MESWVSDLPDGGWRKIVFKAGVTTLIVCALAVAGMMIGNFLGGEQTSPQDILTTLALACLLTAPVLSFLMAKLQQLHSLNRQLHVLATTDFLTGALNRRAFIACVETRIAELAATNLSSQSALLVIDVDHFKVINDRFGHQTGDLALVRIADTLSFNLRETDLFGRLGGEEFGVFLDSISPAEAIQVAERCRVAISQCSFMPEGETHALSVSIGIALSAQSEDFASLFKKADDLLYAAKAHGRNRIEPAAVPHVA